MEHLTKSDQAIKFECLKIAISAAVILHPTSLSYSADQLLEDAEKIEKYVLGKQSA